MFKSEKIDFDGLLLLLVHSKTPLKPNFSNLNKNGHSENLI